MTLKEAIEWHKHGKQTSPKARSVQATQAIIDQLKKMYNNHHTSGCEWWAWGGICDCGWDDVREL